MSDSELLAMVTSANAIRYCSIAYSYINVFCKLVNVLLITETLLKRVYTLQNKYIVYSTTPRLPLGN